MKRRLIVCIYIFLIIIGGNSPIISSTKKNYNNDNNIKIDYLKNLPLNDYILGPGDKLRIIVSRDYPELETFSAVDGEGTIYLPKLNKIYVEGLTVNELINVLNEALYKFVKFPEVEVRIESYRPIRVLVKGEVENPGLQTLSGAISAAFSSTNIISPEEKGTGFRESNLENPSKTFEPNFISYDSSSNTFFFPTLFDVIRQSGGITQFADLSNIKIIRKNNLSDGGGKITTSIDFEEVLISGNNSQNIRIYDSDVIVVSKAENPNNSILNQASLSNLNPRFIDVFITGRVKRAGNIKVPKLSVLSDAVLTAGGAEIIKGPVTFIRFNSDGTVEKRKFRYNVNAKRGSYKNPYLKNKDLVYIGESFFTATSQIINEFASPIVSSYALIKLID